MKTATTDLRKKMKNAAAEEEEGKDLISELPDTIIIHILSFLDMKYVMQTSFLSKRWRYLWMTLTFLKFSQSVYDLCRNAIEAGLDDDEAPVLLNRSGFTDFVDRVLFLRNQSSNIQKFSLFCQDFKQHKILGHIYTWIHVLVRRNVEVIDLRAWSNYKNIEFPHCLFTCKTLTTLKLNMGHSGPVFHLPTNSTAHHLPALKILHLTYVRIVYAIEYLISNAPVLETLIFFNCTNCVEDQLTISALELKNLVIHSMFDDENQLDYSCFKVFAPKLTSFSCKDFPINDYSFVNDNTSLENAIIEADTDANYFFENNSEFDAEFDVSEFWVSRKQTYIQNVIKCLIGICHVRYLTLSARLLEIVTEGPADLGSLPLDKFCNLKVLKLKTTLTKCEIRGIMYFLMKCPHLETPEIEVESKSNSEQKDECWGVQLGPEYKMHNLKLIKIQGILTNVIELDFLMFLLKNSIILEKIIVSTSQQQPLINDMHLKQFEEWLATFQATSSKIEILFLLDAKPRKPDGIFLGRF